MVLSSSSGWLSGETVTARLNRTWTKTTSRKPNVVRWAPADHASTPSTDGTGACTSIQLWPLPVLGLRAAGAQARGFGYFAAKVHPDVRVLDEGGTLLGDRIDAAVRAGASALLCFALPRHSREVVDALQYARAAGLTIVTVADSSFAPVARHSDLLLPAAVGTALVFDTACAPMMLGRVLLEAMCDGIPDAQARLEEFDTRAAERGLFAD